MRTFPGFRAVGHAMRWARQQVGVQVDRHRDPETGHIDITWWRPDSHTIVRYLPGDDGASLDLETDGAYFEGFTGDAVTALRVLAALDLIPADLASGTWLDQAIERFGQPRIALPEPVIRPGLNRRCWVWFVNGENHNVAIDLENGWYRVTAGGPHRRAGISSRTEPTDAEIRSVLNHAWPGYQTKQTEREAGRG